MPPFIKQWATQMDTKQFLSTVLSDRGYYCVWAKRDDEFKQKFYGSLDKLVEQVELLDSSGFDTYFALSTFETKKTRKAKNAKFVKALFLDIDCGEGKPYPDQVAAIGALKKFCKEVGVPKPTALVNSGHGVHVYWGLTEAQTKEAWLPVAERLKAVCEENNLHADPVVTADVARILRVPNTHNFKTAPARPVEILGGVGNLVELSDFAEALGKEVTMTEMAKWGEIDAFKESNDNLAGYNFHKKSFKRLLKNTKKGKGCRQIAHHIEYPNDISYDAWLDLLSIVKFCDDTDDAMLHKVSKGYDNYSRKETQTVADSLESPHTCERFETNNPGGCKGCKFRGKIHTPIVIGKVIEEAAEEDNVVTVPNSNIFATDKTQATEELETHVIPTYPKPYFRGTNGGVYVRKKDKDGDEDEELIWAKDLYLTKRVNDPLKGPSFVFKLHTDRDGVKEFIASSVELTSKEEFRKAMCKNGLHILYYQVDPLMRYTQAWVRHLQATQDETNVRTQFGWTKDAKSFVVGDREIFANKVEHNAPSSFTNDLFHIFEKKGSLEEWKQIAEFYNRPGFEEHQMMMGVSFGSPLMRFVPAINGGVYHMYSSGTGFGKTTSQLGAASVWGKPKDFLLGGSDTMNSIWNRAAAYKDLPVLIDELSNRESKELSSFIYEVTIGRQKNRMSGAGQNQERYRGDEWNLLVGTSANVSLIDRISKYRKSPQAENARIMEVQIARKFTESADVAITLELNRLMEQNYGWAGDIFVQELLKQPNLGEQEVLLMMNRLVNDAGLRPENRVWTGTFAAAIAALKIAKEQCGLVNYDIEAMVTWAVGILKRMKSAAAELGLDANQIINEFYYEHLSSILRVRSTDVRSTNGEDEGAVLPDNKPLHTLVGRHEYDIDKFWVLPKVLKNWCVDNNYNYNTIFELLEEDLGAQRTKMRITRGTKMRLRPMWTIEMDWSESDNSEELKKMGEIDHLANENTDN